MIHRPDVAEAVDTSRNIAVIGAGKIGELVVALLVQHYKLSVYDRNLQRAQACAGAEAEAAQLEVSDEEALLRHLRAKRWWSTVVLTSVVCPLHGRRCALAPAT